LIPAGVLLPYRVITLIADSLWHRGTGSWS